MIQRYTYKGDTFVSGLCLRGSAPGGHGPFGLLHAPLVDGPKVPFAATVGGKVQNRSECPEKLLQAIRFSFHLSHPVRGAWIEMSMRAGNFAKASLGFAFASTRFYLRRLMVGHRTFSPATGVQVPAQIFLFLPCIQRIAIAVRRVLF